jgi:hypothetical protein
MGGGRGVSRQAPALSSTGRAGAFGVFGTRAGCYVPDSARRPASVIVNRNMLSVRPPAFTISGLATASPVRTIAASSRTVNPCARNAPSVHPAA